MSGHYNQTRLGVREVVQELPLISVANLFTSQFASALSAIIDAGHEQSQAYSVEIFPNLEVNIPAQGSHEQQAVITLTVPFEQSSQMDIAPWQGSDTASVSVPTVTVMAIVSHISPFFLLNQGNCSCPE